MTLKEQAANYIKLIGVEGAAQRFGKKVSTIKRWISTGEYPIEVAEASLLQKVDDPFLKEAAIQPPVQEAVYTPEPVAEPEPAIFAGVGQDQILEMHRQALVIIGERLGNVEEFLSRMSAPLPPPPPVREPSVVTGQPVDTSNIRPVFSTKAPNLGGPIAPTNTVPETKPDTFGATMKALLVPYDYAQRRRG